MTSTLTRDGLDTSGRPGTCVRVTRPPGGGRVRVELWADADSDRPTLRPMLLSSDDQGARVCLVPDGALLLAGDAVSVHVQVGAGARLELVEPAGTVAYAMDRTGRHGAQAGVPGPGRPDEQSAHWDVTIDLDAAASMVWAGEPFVVSAGARVARRTRVRLSWRARLALREVLVLGRYGEAPGHLDTELEVDGPEGVPLLHEQLTVGPDDSPLLLGGARVVGTVALLGARLPTTSLVASGGVRLDLEGEGTVVRRLTSAAHRATSDDIWDAARAAASSPLGSATSTSAAPSLTP